MKEFIYKCVLVSLIITGLSCATKPVQKKIPVKPLPVKPLPVIPEKIIQKDKLTRFFEMCETDVKNAKTVIVDQDIVKNLSHLLNMGHGGKKYYLLEREAITKVILSVTKGVYSDYILINKKGRLIYTMRNDDIFGENVRGSQLKTTPLHRCYQNRNKEVYFEDLTSFPSISEEYSIFISIKVKGKNSFPGIFILQLNINKIARLLEKDTTIIGKDGKYRVPPKHNDTNYFSYEHFNKIDLAGLNGDKTGEFEKPGGDKAVYKLFAYRNINWIIIR
ncbi:MAG: hypothetical protein GY754_25285 [bacterium]|nr:hypothetical protein [bacterium]